ncbi:hypothetical protein COOONC_00974 [Cooperia oncophora]
MHVSKQKGQTLIIGTNALPYALVYQGEKSETKTPVALGSGADGNDFGKALSGIDRICYKFCGPGEQSCAPGEFKWVSIKGAARPGETHFHSRFAGMRSVICCMNDSGVQLCAGATSVESRPEVGHYEKDDVEYILVKSEEAATVLGRPTLQESERKRLLSNS